LIVCFILIIGISAAGLISSNGGHDHKRKILVVDPPDPNLIRFAPDHHAASPKQPIIALQQEKPTRLEQALKSVEKTTELASNAVQATVSSSVRAAAQAPAQPAHAGPDTTDAHPSTKVQSSPHSALPDTRWKPEVLALARQAYSSWKKVQDANEPDTVAGMVSRINNTAFKWVSQKPSISTSAAQACPSPPCYENKKFGGDDYFVLITTADYREHVATCTDHEDGTYTFRFDATCGEEVVGNMSVVLEFTHGQALTRTKKLEYLKRTVLLHAPNTVIRTDAAMGKLEMTETQRRPTFTKAPGLFDRFDTIMAFGCSLTRQITDEAVKQSGRQIHYLSPASPLNSHVLQSKFIAPMKPWEDMYNAAKDKSKIAIIFNSGIWDVLLANPGSESQHPPEDMYFDHLQALSNWTDYIRAKFPEAVIFFKETTTLHAHETMCSFITRNKLLYKCQQRNMYMAGALTNVLRRLQNAMMRTKNIPMLLQYDTTFRHPSFALDGDGRHFVGPLNDLMWKSWTYIDGKWTTQLLCPAAFYTWMSSAHPEHKLMFSKGLARSYVRAGIKL
jgi:hypothetical protein